MQFKPVTLAARPLLLLVHPRIARQLTLLLWNGIDAGKTHGTAALAVHHNDTAPGGSSFADPAPA